ncbi:hypothetical protein Lser_V15G08278 [Lactuca serriola]
MQRSGMAIGVPTRGPSPQPPTSFSLLTPSSFGPQFHRGLDHPGSVSMPEYETSTSTPQVRQSICGMQGVGMMGSLGSNSSLRPSGVPASYPQRPRIISKRSIHEIVAQIDPGERLDPEVDGILVGIADDFVESNVLVFLVGNEMRDIEARQGTYEPYNILLEWNLEFRFCQNRILNSNLPKRMDNIVWDEDEQ